MIQRSAVVVTLCALIAVVAVTWPQHSTYLRWTQQLEQTLHLRREIARLDQVLTVNAILAAATGDRKWQDIYLEHEPVLDRVLSDAQALLARLDVNSDADGLTGIDATSDANTALVNMEHEALAVAASGRLAEAIKILAGSEYSQAKARYNDCLRTLGESLEQLVEQKGHELAEHSYWLGLSAICTLVLATAATALMLFDHRRQARLFQGEIAATRDRLELAVKSADLGLWDWNIRTGEVVFSDSFAAQLGYEFHELKPHVSTWHELLHPDDKSAALAATQQILARPDAQYEDQFRLRAKDGTWKTMIARGRVVARTARGSAARMVGTFVDISDRMHTETQLSQTRRLESIGQLAAGIAHEINTPMQFVSDNIEYLDDCARKLFEVVDAYQKNLEDDGQPKSWQQRRDELNEVIRRTHFERIREHIPSAIAESMEGIHRVIQIVRAMKEFSHPGREVKLGVDLNNAVRSAVTITRNRWKYAAEMELDLDPNLPTVTCAPAEINQVLLNLIVNAADALIDKYGDNTGDKGTITIRTRSEAGYVAIEVEDTGCGIPAEIRDRIFDPFFTTKVVGKGSGQGLSICYNVVVNKHGGTLDVESTPGVGSTFRICLPLQTQSAIDDEPVPVGAGMEEVSAELMLTATND